MKLLIVGIDALDPIFIDDFIDDLPTFQKLRQECEWHLVHCDAKVPNSAAGWASIYSGLLAHEHGILDWDLESWLGIADTINSDGLLWEWLNAVGLSVGLLGAPLVWPAKMKDGWCVGGFPNPSTKKGLYSSREVELLAPLSYTVDAQDYAEGFLTDEARDTWYVRRIKELAELRTEFALRLLLTYPVDVGFVVYIMLDRLAHALSYFLPKRPPLAKVESEIWEGYMLMDDLLGDLLEETEYDSLIVCGDHGLNFSTRAPVIKNLEGDQVVDDPYSIGHTWTTMGLSTSSAKGETHGTDLTWVFKRAFTLLGIEPPNDVQRNRKAVFPPEEEEIARQKLAGLGYVEKEGK